MLILATVTHPKAHEEDQEETQHLLTTDAGTLREAIINAMAAGASITLTRTTALEMIEMIPDLAREDDLSNIALCEIEGAEKDLFKFVQDLRINLYLNDKQPKIAAA